MVPARFQPLSLPLILALAIAACAPSEGGDNDSAPEPLLGYELAIAADAPPSRDFRSQPIDSTSEQSEILNLSPEQLAERIDTGDIFLIDVRTAEEVAEGALPGAVNIPLDTFSPSPALLERAGDREIVLYCRSGRRSGIAARSLSGFLGKPVPHLNGGILAWSQAGKSTE